jgi:hypothetical protein
MKLIICSLRNGLASAVFGADVCADLFPCKSRSNFAYNGVEIFFIIPTNKLGLCLMHNLFLFFTLGKSAACLSEYTFTYHVPQK